MTVINPNYQSEHRLAGLGPQLGFAGATFAAFAAWAGLVVTTPADYVIPLIATLLFAFSAVFAVIAWRKRNADPFEVTYWDTAGALLLIGLCVCALIDPEQMVRIAAAAN